MVASNPGTRSRFPPGFLCASGRDLAKALAVEIIAHRGASFDAPENTLAAVQLGWQQKADAVEIDVQMSKDKKIVVIHDDNTRKPAGVKKKVCDQSLAQLRTLDAGQWKGSQWTGEKIPTLEEVLDTIPDGKRLFIEIKCGPECLPEFAKVVKRSGKKAEQIVPIGFSLPTMALCKKKMPELETCWVAEFKRNWTTGRWSPAPEHFIQQASNAGLDGLDLGARGPIDSTLVKQLKAARLKLYIWTVDAPLQARRLAEAGVHGIATNRPAWLREKMGLKSAAN